MLDEEKKITRNKMQLLAYLVMGGKVDDDEDDAPSTYDPTDDFDRIEARNV